MNHEVTNKEIEDFNDRFRPMKKTDIEYNGEWCISVKSQDGGQKAGYGLRILTVNYIPTSTTMSASGYRSETKAVKALKACIELLDGERI